MFNLPVTCTCKTSACPSQVLKYLLYISDFTRPPGVAADRPRSVGRPADDEVRPQIASEIDGIWWKVDALKTLCRKVLSKFLNFYK